MSSGGGNAVGRNLQLVRLSIVGASGTGKTSLISAFVNNSCPTVHAETTEAALYYRTLQVLPGKSDAGSQAGAGGAASLASKVTLNALVEIEDTPPSNRGARNQSGQSGGMSQSLAGALSRPMSPLRQTSPGSRPTSPGSMPYQRDMEKYITCKRKPDVRWSTTPFKGISAPKAKEFDPVGAGRMGFIVVFDATDPTGETLMAAKDLIDRLLRQDLTQDVRPIIYVVANKADKLVLNSDVPVVCAVAKEYASERKLRYEELSAMDLKKVRGVFRNLVSDIRDKPSLWKPPDDAFGGAQKPGANRSTSKASEKGVVSNDSVSDGIGNNCKMQ